MADLKITDGTVMGFNYNMVNLGGPFRFGVRKNITIQVSKILCGKAPEEGSIGSQAKELDDLIATKDYIKLTVNGYEFTERFQLTDFTIGDGNWLNVTEGTITVQAFEEGNIDTMVPSDADDYLGWFNVKGWEFIEEFSDDFVFSRSANKISYKHSVKIKVAAINPDTEGQHITPPLTIGLNVARQLVAGGDGERPSFGWLKEPSLQGIYTKINTASKRLITESVDEINNTVDVTESFDAENIKEDESGDCLYSFSAKQSIEVGEKGVINVSEKGTVINLLRNEDDNLRADPDACLQIEINNAIDVDDGRLEKMFQAYKDEIGKTNECQDEIPDLVKTDPEDGEAKLVLLEKGINRDPFRGKASYSVKATNDQKIGELASHEYTVEIEALKYDEDVDCLPFLRVSQNGTFIGIDPKNFLAVGADEDKKVERPRMDKALEAWDAAREGIKDGLRECYDAIPENAYPTSMNNSYSPYKGKVSYSIGYSSESKYGTENDPYKLWTFDYSDSMTTRAEGDDVGDCLFQYTLQNVIKHKDQLPVLQTRNTTVIPSSSSSVRMVGKRNSTLKGLLKALVESEPSPNSNDAKTLKDCNYTFNNHNDKVLNTTFNWQ